MPSNYPPKLRSATQYLKDCPSAFQKGAIRRILTRRMKEAGQWSGKWPLSRMTNISREMLADAIFEVEDRLESRAGGMPDDPVVVALREARIRVYVDLRWEAA